VRRGAFQNPLSCREEATMSPEMQSLLELSELDAKLRGVTMRREERQRAVAEAEKAVAEAEATCGTKREEARTLQREADALNLDMKTAEGEVSKLEDQQRTAKSNKEYDIFKREIEAAKEKKSGLEDGVLERLERIDAIEAEEKAARDTLAEAKKALEKARAEAAAAEKEIVSEESGHKTKRDALATKLDPELRHTYERLLGQRKDSAMAKVVNGVCSKCSRKITRQMEAMLDIGQEIIQCMSCNRILYVDETASVP
jgi:predicted  nucleic acid-binding Zn-ribbon protein